VVYRERGGRVGLSLEALCGPARFPGDRLLFYRPVGGHGNNPGGVRVMKTVLIRVH